jgi:hypothetical protein
MICTVHQILLGWSRKWDPQTSVSEPLSQSEASRTCLQWRLQYYVELYFSFVHDTMYYKHVKIQQLFFNWNKFIYAIYRQICTEEVFMTLLCHMCLAVYELYATCPIMRLHIRPWVHLPLAHSRFTISVPTECKKILKISLEESDLKYTFRYNGKAWGYLSARSSNSLTPL